MNSEFILYYIYFLIGKVWFILFYFKLINENKTGYQSCISYSAINIARPDINDTHE